MLVRYTPFFYYPATSNPWRVVKCKQCPTPCIECEDGAFLRLFFYVGVHFNSYSIDPLREGLIRLYDCTMTIAQVLRLLKHDFLFYTDNYDKVSTYDELMELYGNTQGGWMSAAEIARWNWVPGDTPMNEELPSLVQNMLTLPSLPSNNPTFRQTYIDECNRLLIGLSTRSFNAISIDLTKNQGGKTHSMAAALAPIFNLYPDPYLTFAEFRLKRVGDLQHHGGVYTDLYAGENVTATQQKYKHLQMIDVYTSNLTASAGETIAIALGVLREVGVKVNYYGPRTAGSTTLIKYVELDDGSGIEFPVAYVADKHHIYKKGI